MKALTLHQPWAWAIAHAGKRIENRSWRPPRNLIGQRIAIHQGQGWSYDQRIWGTSTPPPTRALLQERGMVGAVVATTEVFAFGDDSWLYHGGFASLDDLRWYCGPVGWMLHDVRPLAQPVPCNGAQGLWTLSDELAAAVAAQEAA